MVSTELPAVDLPTLAADLASGGFAGHDAAIRSIVHAARARGLCPVLVGILADPREPEVARLRAFGRIAVAISRRPAATMAPRTQTAA